jgi:hypothetical protein
MVRKTFPSPSMRMEAFRVELSAMPVLPSPNGKLRLNIMPPPTATLLIKLLRRNRGWSNPWGRWWIMISSQSTDVGADCFFDVASAMTRGNFTGALDVERPTMPR